MLRNVQVPIDRGAVEGRLAFFIHSVDLQEAVENELFEFFLITIYCLRVSERVKQFITVPMFLLSW